MGLIGFDRERRTSLSKSPFATPSPVAAASVKSTHILPALDLDRLGELIYGPIAEAAFPWKEQERGKIPLMRVNSPTGLGKAVRGMLGAPAGTGMLSAQRSPRRSGASNSGR